MDVVHAVEESRTTVARWAAAMRRLNAIDDPLARKVLALHRECGSGSGPCDTEDDLVRIADRGEWGCETTSVIASHFGVTY
jgi:hypothetical protein